MTTAVVEMDGLSESLGRLSTTAQEWIPETVEHTQQQQEQQEQQQQQQELQQEQLQQTQQHHQQQQRSIPADWQYQSELSASSVKEFVPGRAWISGSGSGGLNEGINAGLNTGQLNSPGLSSCSNQGQTLQESSWHTSSGEGHFQRPERGTYDRTNANSVVHQHHHHHQQQHQQQQLQLEEQQQHTGPLTVPSGPSPPPSVAFRSLHSLGLSDSVWRYHRDLSLECNRQMDPGDPRHKAIPEPYCNAYCLDSGSSGSRSSFGYPSTTFQATSREDGFLYCVRRFDNVRSVSPRIAAAVTEKWNSAASVEEHPGVAPLYHCFVAQRAVFFVNQFVPGARTLRERLGGPLSEPVVWSAVAQLSSAIRIVHANNLAVRTLHLQHILSNTDPTGSRLRLRLNCLGVVDALEFESRKNVLELQDEDIRDLGRLILSISTGTEITSSTENEIIVRCEAFLAQNYSRELHNLSMTLIRSLPRPPSIVDVSRAMGQRGSDEQDAAYVSLDQAERALMGEYESGRALRLLLKLGFVNERPEFGPNRRWSQSGDCYVLTLFRDYVFHQADSAGNPVMDLGHVITALNKLDAADEEKIVLSSRDGKSLMVVSFADVARCLESAFGELCAGSVPPTALPF